MSTGAICLQTAVIHLCHHHKVADKRFLQLPDVAEMLDISMSQVYALVRRGDLRAIKIGGRGQWRVESNELEDYIQRCYADTDAEVRRGQLDLGDAPRE